MACAPPGCPTHIPLPDDFIVVGATEQCAEALFILDRECGRLGIPIANHKQEGPTICLVKVYLGIEVDTGAFQLWLPEDRLLRLKMELNEWGDCPRKELGPFIGLLNHAYKVHVCEVGEIALETYD